MNLGLNWDTVPAFSISMKMTAITTILIKTTTCTYMHEYIGQQEQQQQR